MGTGAGETLEMVLDGCGTWEGRKVVVASGRTIRETCLTAQGDQVFFTGGGYTLFDAQTMAPVKSELYAIFELEGIKALMGVGMTLELR